MIHFNSKYVNAGLISAFCVGLFFIFERYKNKPTSVADNTVSQINPADLSGAGSYQLPDISAPVYTGSGTSTAPTNAGAGTSGYVGASSGFIPDDPRARAGYYDYLNAPPTSPGSTPAPVAASPITLQDIPAIALLPVSSGMIPRLLTVDNLAPRNDRGSGARILDITDTKSPGIAGRASIANEINIPDTNKSSGGRTTTRTPSTPTPVAAPVSAPVEVKRGTSVAVSTPKTQSAVSIGRLAALPISLPAPAIPAAPARGRR